MGGKLEVGGVLGLHGRKGETMRKLLGKLIILLVVIALVGGFYLYPKYFAKHPMDGIAMEAMLQDCAELTTQTLVVTDVFEESTGSIPIVTKNNYLVKYRATVNAGFDVKKAMVETTDSRITVCIPHCRIDEDSVNVRGKDIKTYDTNFAILSPSENDVLKLVEKAEKHALEYAERDESGLLEAADANAERLVKSLFSGVADGREIVVEFE